MNNLMNNVDTAQATEIISATILDGFKRNVVPMNVMLHGAVGIGKSSIINVLPSQIATSLGVAEDQVVLVDIRLNGMSDGADLTGIPYVHEGTLRFSTPEWYPKDDGKYYIIFFDEMNTAHQSVMSAALRVLLDRTIQNGTSLPTRCAIVAAGNRKKDKTGAKTLPPAAANRFGIHLNLETDMLVEPFIDYAISQGWNRSIVGYLTWRKGNLYVNDGDNEAFTTPRSWEFVNNHLNNQSLPAHLLDTVIAGAIGTATAMDFAGFREYDGQLPDFEKIRKGTTTFKIPEGEEGLKFAIASSLGFEVTDAMRKDAESEVTNLLHILDQLPKELHVVTFRVIVNTPDIRRKVMSYSEVKTRFVAVSDKMRAIKQIEQGA